MYKDYFLNIKGENCFIRKPKISNGFGIIVLGGSGCYVTEDTSDFHRNSIRNEFLNNLVNTGYTIGYSNSHNKSWGSEFAIKDVENLYAIMTNNFNVNRKIHLIGISMGGILALNILKANTVEICSMVLMKPVMDLISHKNYILNVEKIDRIKEELSIAYKINQEDILEYLVKNNFNLEEDKHQKIPVKIVYGESDNLVPFENNNKVVEKLINFYPNVEITSLNGANHKDDNLFFNIELYKEFLNKSE